MSWNSSSKLYTWAISRVPQMSMSSKLLMINWAQMSGSSSISYRRAALIISKLISSFVSTLPQYMNRKSSFKTFESKSLISTTDLSFSVISILNIVLKTVDWVVRISLWTRSSTPSEAFTVTSAASSSKKSCLKLLNKVDPDSKFLSKGKPGNDEVDSSLATLVNTITLRKYRCQSAWRLNVWVSIIGFVKVDEGWELYSKFFFANSAAVISCFIRWRIFPSFARMSKMILISFLTSPSSSS